MELDRCNCINGVNASNVARVKVNNWFENIRFNLEFQECSFVLDYKIEAISRKNACKESVRVCKTASVRDDIHN